ncbi:dienelactone hydrolase family protein [Cohnella suwonensis]|uniref:Dienelactone hydrolase family protein n=1 Tax=Cohnella suwonensis TaxID=696072 RepID=A0ABW0M274_9BACL
MIKKTRKSLVILLHEIYGINDHINMYRSLMVEAGFDVISPNLLQRDSFAYDQEDIAYQFFMNEVGFNKSIQIVNQIINENRNQYNKIYIIGFSIGATIAWCCSEFKVDGIIGYYGSRIRNSIGIEPKCLTLLFFPINEKSFDVIELERQLKPKEKLKFAIIQADHGFMNPFNKCFNIKEYQECLDLSMNFLSGIEEDTGIR